MKMLRHPRCRGSGQLVLDMPELARQQCKRERCRYCKNIVAVRNGRFCEHWWSATVHRYDASKRRAK